MLDEDIWEHPEAISSPLLEKLGIKVLQADAAQSVARMPAEGNTQIAGLLHGGATAALAETVASVAASVHAANLEKERFSREEAARAANGEMDAGKARHLIAVGTELSISHLVAARTGTVSATAASEHLGRRRTVHTVKVRNEEGRLLAVAQATNMIVEA